jgi:hypothetical protein
MTAAPASAHPPQLISLQLRRRSQVEELRALERRQVRFAAELAAVDS